MAKYKPSLTVFLAATSAFMGALNIGMVMVWTSLAFDSLEASDSVPRITKNDQNIKSWIASITSIGGMFGGLLSSKKTFIIITIYIITIAIITSQITSMCFYKS